MENLLHELRKSFDYNPATGIFTWKIRKPKIRPGMIAGGTDSHGYRQIKISGRLYLAHRLAWLYVYGEWPQSAIDHINGNPSDNRLFNLRLASPVQNARNKRVTRQNKLGIKGVCFNKKAGKFIAQISINKKVRHLGYYNTPEEAAAAYRKAALEVDALFYRLH